MIEFKRKLFSGGLLTADAYGGGVIRDNSLDSYGTAAGSVFSVAGRRAGQGVAVAAAAIDSLQTAAIDSLQEAGAAVMSWLPGRNRRTGRGERRSWASRLRWWWRRTRWRKWRRERRRR